MSYMMCLCLLFIAAVISASAQSLLTFKLFKKVSFKTNTKCALDEYTECMPTCRPSCQPNYIANLGLGDWLPLITLFDTKIGQYPIKYYRAQQLCVTVF